MRVYLAGKVDAEHGAWRDAILGRHYDYATGDKRPKWELVNHHGTFMEATDEYDYGHVEPPPWPTTPNAHVLGIHDYVGPYRLTYPDSEPKSSGYFHGTTWLGQHGMIDDHRAHIVLECQRALQRADFVFAYINSPDCFGTIAELGMAHQMGKYVALLVEDSVEWAWDDYWFVHELVAYVDHRSRTLWNPETDKETIREEGAFVLDSFREALVHWTGRKPTPMLATVSTEQKLLDEMFRYGQSFHQISRWTSDPRVRTEAAKMAERIRQVVGR